MSAGGGIQVHFVVEGGDLFARRVLDFPPAVGDELRFSENRFFTVTRLVWVYDEPEARRMRLNVGMVPAK
jgi:hypothetical protein